MPVSLAERLRESIRREGAITFHDWMKAALYDPKGGYYQRSDRVRWGREGDYRTSPERSELFAATFARYFARLHDQLKSFTIVECGAGDGTFAAGVLRTLQQQFPGVFADTRYVVCELSEDARAHAQQRLREFGERVQVCAGLNSVSASAGIWFANELLDAFPIHRVVQSDEGLSELYVTVDADGSFVWTQGALSTPRLAEFCSANVPQLVNGQIIEINLDVEDWLTQVATKLEAGFLITVDYGAEAAELYNPALRPQGTLRGFSEHAFVENVLAQPGDYDLTSSVNWTQVRTTGERLGFEVVDFTSQDKFLMGAGLLDQLQYRLSSAKTESEQLSLTTSAREMILPGGMASSFQVLVLKGAREINDPKH